MGRLTKFTGLAGKKWGLPKNRGMGFRDLESFNQAMLAKQFWRIITRPQSFVVLILKEKYFKLGTILDAKPKSDSSFMWKSILGTKLLVENWLRWQVGNGTKIKIWEDKWINSPSSFQIQTPINRLPSDARVKKLMVEEGRKWNTRLINEVFWKEEAYLILQIPISQRGGDDQLFWGYTKKGNFSVRSAYFLAI